MDDLLCTAEFILKRVYFLMAWRERKCILAPVCTLANSRLDSLVPLGTVVKVPHHMITCLDLLGAKVFIVII